MRKVLIVIVIILLVSTGILYWYSKKQPTSTEQPPGATTFFPSDALVAPGSDLIINDGSTGVQTGQNTSLKFKQLSQSPVAGFSAFTQTLSKTIPSEDPKKKPTTETVVDRVIRYIARGNGYVYEIRNSTTPLQISNIYIPNVYEGHFADTNNTAILRFLRDDQRTIATYSVPIPSENQDGTRTQKQGIYLPEKITNLSVYADQKQITYLTSDNQNASILSATSQNTGRKELLRTPFHEWIIIQSTPKTVWLQTKAAAIADGFLYKIDTTDRRLVRVLGNIKGLTTSVSPSGTYILYSQSTSTGFITRLLNTKTGVSNNLNIALLPEKCTWLKNEDLICAGNGEMALGSYPDMWYSGLVSFKDKFYRIYTTSNTYTILSDGTERAPDATNLQVDENQDIVFFIDKPTGLLWQLSF